MADIIDGKALAATLRASLGKQIKNSKSAPPHLAIVLVGDHEPSQIYVRNKQKAAAEAGIKTTVYAEPASISQSALLARLSQLNIDPDVQAILVQLPLPAHIDRQAVLQAISPLKDVDGLTPLSQGLLMVGQPRFIPCTPLGCLKLIQTLTSDFAGAEAVVVGRSQIVGNPMAQLLLQQDCTVTVTHKETRDLADHTRKADILVVAAGAPGLITAAHVKPGAIVIDVGINRLADGTLTGDVDFASVSPIAAATSPVPGGVGPMTIACLLENTVYAASLQAKK